jgi:hypothetical protein
MDTDGLLSIPVTLDLQPPIVQAAAAVAVAEIVRIVILKGLFRHVLSFGNRNLIGRVV